MVTVETRRVGRLVAASRDAEAMTPFVVTWFRFRHTRGGRRPCGCWICTS
jgi:hypothetical protein